MFSKILNYIYRLDLAGYWPKPNQNEILICATSKYLMLFWEHIDISCLTAEFLLCRQPSFTTNICATTHLYDHPVWQTLAVVQMVCHTISGLTKRYSTINILSCTGQSYKWESQLSNRAICY